MIVACAAFPFGLNLQPILLVAPPNEDSISQFSRYH